MRLISRRVVLIIAKEFGVLLCVVGVSCHPGNSKKMHIGPNVKRIHAGIIVDSDAIFSYVDNSDSMRLVYLDGGCQIRWQRVFGRSLISYEMMNDTTLLVLGNGEDGKMTKVSWIKAFDGATQRSRLFAGLFYPNGTTSGGYAVQGTKLSERTLKSSHVDSCSPGERTIIWDFNLEKEVRLFDRCSECDFISADQITKSDLLLLELCQGNGHIPFLQISRYAMNGLLLERCRKGAILSSDKYHEFFLDSSNILILAYDSTVSSVNTISVNCSDDPIAQSGVRRGDIAADWVVLDYDEQGRLLVYDRSNQSIVVKYY